MLCIRLLTPKSTTLFTVQVEAWPMAKVTVLYHLKMSTWGALMFVIMIKMHAMPSEFHDRLLYTNIFSQFQ